MVLALLNSLFWAFLSGLVCGFLPLYLGNHRNRPILGLAGLALCIISGALLGWYGALPMALITSLSILAIAWPSAAEQSPKVARTDQAEAPVSNEYLDFIPLDSDGVRADADL